jgi:hypothetical protein
MGWFRRSRPSTDIEAAGAPRHLPVPVATAPALARTERALELLAGQTAQLHAWMIELEHRVDGMARALLEEMERPTYEDVMAARVHSAKTAAELARLEVNLSARLDALRTELAAAKGDPPVEIDRRSLTPVDTGWDRRTA